MPFGSLATSGDSGEKDIALIKVIGVGGGGISAINYMIKKRLAGLEFLAVDSDWEALRGASTNSCLQLGPIVAKGLSASSDRGLGKQAGIESVEDIKQSLADNDLVIVLAGFGGGIGSGAAPVIAKLSRELGILTVAIITIPFHFEGKFRMQNAEAGLKELRKHVDGIHIIKNNELFSIIPKFYKLSDLLGLAERVSFKTVEKIVDVSTVKIRSATFFADMVEWLRIGM